MMCDMYRSAEGENLCEAIRGDPKCRVDDSMTLHESIAYALWSPSHCPVGQEMKRKLCECSCWSKIVEVYIPMLEQWSKYDGQVAAKGYELKAMCKKDVMLQPFSYFAESRKTQCASNIITITIVPYRALPVGTVVTVEGLNGDSEPALVESPLLESSSSILSGLSWTPARCSEWCSKSGFCPETGNARDNSCLARPTPAAGHVTGQRCIRWCDADARVTVTLNGTLGEGDTLVFAIRLLNPPFEQVPIPVMVSITGPGVYAEPSAAYDEYGDQSGALSAADAPAFTYVSIGESGCDGYLDSASSVWRGSCAGMVNTLKVTIVPNLEMYSGTLLEISGLVRSGAAWPPPVVISGPDLLSSLTIDDWKSDGGVLMLRLLDGGSSAEGPIIGAGEPAVIGLEFLMPSDVDDADIQKPPIRISATRAGSKHECAVMEYNSTEFTVLVAKAPSGTSFKTRSISASSCHPGECNDLTVTLLTNKALHEDQDVTISITGLAGMDMSSPCNPRTSCSPDAVNDIELFDAVDGSNHRNLFRSVNNNTGMASWNAATSRVVMRLAQGVHLEAYKEYGISFRLQNGLVASDLSTQIKVAAMMSNGDCLAGLTASLSEAGDMTCDGTSEAMTQADPVRVCAPGFITKDIGQSFPWPGCDGRTNDVTVTLQPNVKMEAGSVITLRNFLGPADYTKEAAFCDAGCAGSTFYPRGQCSMLDRQGNCTCSTDGVASCSVYNSSNHTDMNVTSTCECVIRAVQLNETHSHDSTLHWDDAASRIDLTVGEALQAGDVYSFSFIVTNPVQSQQRPLITVEATTPAITIGASQVDHDMTSIPIARRTSAGDAAALLIQDPHFVVRNIGQSNPYPNAVNQITVTLIANIALASKASPSSRTNITIAGLVGSDTSDTNNLIISQSSPPTHFLSNGTWVKDTGTLVISVLDDMKWDVDDEEIIFSFELLNPGSCHSSPDVSVSAQAAGTDCASYIAPALMIKDSTTVPFATCRACGTDNGHCDACRQCDQLCNQQDAYPLKVHAPAFVLKEVGQSTTWPGAKNSIFVTFATNIDLTSAAAIFVSGFSGGSATNGTINITSDSSQLQTAEWNDAEKLLYVDVGSPGTKSTASPDSTSYVFSFELTNTLTSQRSPLINIWAINAGSCLAPVPKCSMDRPAELADQPLQIDQPGFLSKSVGHSSPFVSAVNTITATFSLNFELTRPAKITIMGIMGRSTPSNEALSVESGALLSETGVWMQDTGSLVLSLAENTQASAGENYTVAFDVVNPPIPQNSPLVSISAGSTDAFLMDTPLTMHVVAPKIVTARIGQSTAAPSAHNVITVTLRTNSPIRSGSHAAFTITGLEGVRARTGPLALRVTNSSSNISAAFKASRDGTPGTGWWQGSDGNAKDEDGWGDMGPSSADPQSLVVMVAGTISHSQDYVFSFEVQNGNCESACPAVTLISNGLEFLPASCSADAGFVPSEVPRSMLVTQGIGAACAGKVYAPLFTTKTISECSTVNSNPNTLTVTLVSNVDLVQGSKISISGLIIDLGAPDDLVLGGRDGALFETTWLPTKGVLMMQVRDDPGIAMNDEIVFNFMLMNPPFGQPALQPTVGAESDDVIITEATMSGSVLGAGDEPAFTAADIAESSSVQRSYNTLMVLFRTNARVPENSVIEIAGLYGTAAPVQRLSGMHSYYFNETLEWDAMTGVLRLHVISAIPPNTNRMFAFEVKNGFARQEPKRPWIAVRCHADWGYELCPWPRGEYIPYRSMTGEVLSFKTPAEFLTRRIGQLTPYPGEANRLTITLATSLEFRANSGEGLLLKVSGLAGAHAVRGPMELSGAHPFTSGCWECRCESASSCEAWVPSEPGSITFHVAGDVSAGRAYTLAFEIVNPFGQQASPDVVVSASFNDCGYVDACGFEDPDVTGVSAACYAAAGTFYSAGMLLKPTVLAHLVAWCSVIPYKRI